MEEDWDLMAVVRSSCSSSTSAVDVGGKTTIANTCEAYLTVDYNFHFAFTKFSEKKYELFQELEEIFRPTSSRKSEPVSSPILSPGGYTDVKSQQSQQKEEGLKNSELKQSGVNVQETNLPRAPQPKLWYLNL